MPSASDAYHNLMERWFGDPIDDGPPYRFLAARGWQDNAGLLVPPVPSHQPSQYELACVMFLCDEWDYAYEGKAKLVPELWSN